ncbi:hypothetical protein BD408DRAFT_45604 [Parasitella parasitica]|nr:hypothetical protein BD408DRAFT_45604 [Parasitella parasitica]
MESSIFLRPISEHILSFSSRLIKDSFFFLLVKPFIFFSIDVMTPMKSILGMKDKSPSSQMDLLPANLKDKANKITRQINQDRSTIDDTVDCILKNHEKSLSMKLKENKKIDPPRTLHVQQEYSDLDYRRRLKGYSLLGTYWNLVERRSNIQVPNTTENNIMNILEIFMMYSIAT